MTTAFAYFLFIGTMVLSLARPWIGAVAIYLNAIWVPQAIWPWVFEETRVIYWVSLTTVLGFLIAVARKRIDFTVLKSKQNLYLAILWLCLLFSYLFPPVPVTPTEMAVFNPDYLIQNMTKVILFYFVSILVIDDKRKCHFLVWAMLFSAVYLVYYGNMEYFTGNLKGLHNTLVGPGYRLVVSVYIDENAFAMFYVMAIPFLYFMGGYYKNRLLKWFLWLNIPFAWHCIFLTGSRGGLVGLGVVTLFMVARSRSKILKIAIPIVLVLAFVYQSGDIMKKRSESALEMEEDPSVRNRFNSWEAGLKMVIEHPLTGVGIGNFLRAYPDYSHTTPFVAHNTLIQFASESGIFAGLMYLLLCFGVISSYVRFKRAGPQNTDPFLVAVQESSTGGLIGFFVCALFLNLATYELFYYILVLHAVQIRLLNETMNSSNSNKIQAESNE